MKKPYAVKVTKVTFFIMLASFLFLVIIGEASIFNVVPFLIGLSYLQFSKRVKATYGHLNCSSKDNKIWTILALIFAIASPVQGIVFAIIALHNLHKRKANWGFGLSIVALLLGLMVFFVQGVSMIAILDPYSEEVSDNIDSQCSVYCSSMRPTIRAYMMEIDSYQFDYDLENDEFICQCLTDGEISQERRLTYKYPS